MNLMWLKMRPDTPQLYEYIRMEDVEAKVEHFLDINPWTQFFDLKDRKDIPLSYADHIMVKDCKCECDTFFAVKTDETQYHLSNFTFENLDIKAVHTNYNPKAIENMVLHNVLVQKNDIQIDRRKSGERHTDYV